MIQKYLMLGVAGALGVWSRYALAGFVQRLAGGAFPWGTATVNITGCFIAGLLFVLLESRFTISVELRTAIMVGFMGAFTTFSTYALETGTLMRDSEWSWALGNMAFQNGCGVILFFAGMALGRAL